MLGLPAHGLKGWKEWFSWLFKLKNQADGWRGYFYVASAWLISAKLEAGSGIDKASLSLIISLARTNTRASRIIEPINLERNGQLEKALQAAFDGA